MTGLFATIFVALLVIIGSAAGLAYYYLFSKHRLDIIKQLEAGASPDKEVSAGGVFLEAGALEAARRAGLLRRFLNSLAVRAASAGVDWSGEVTLAMSVGLGAIGAMIGWMFPFLLFKWLTAVVVAMVFASFPISYLNYCRSRRLRQFEGQFPEALDFIARALRSGHAFSMSLEMLSTEAPEPLSLEFRRLYQELNLGAPMETALPAMAARVPLLDVKFFVSAVLLQRESGGNLSEILTSLAHTVRERFRLKGHIQAATAHARITASVLSAIPLLTLLGLQFTNPEYVSQFSKDPSGPTLFLSAIAAQVIGYLIMRRLINFRI